MGDSNRLDQIAQFKSMQQGEESVAKIGGGPRYTGAGGAGRQQATVTVNYTTNMDSLSSHMQYLEQEGKGENGERPELFGERDNEEISAEPREGEERYYRIVISPENGNKMGEEEFKDYVRDVMRETEQSTGQNLDWAGAVHSNTDQKHAHVVVRGLQKDSDKETYFSPEQVKHGFREAARDCATERLGERTHAERVRADRREVEDERPTRIDRDIGKRSNDVLEGRTGERFQAKPQDGRERQRMEKLEEFGLAQGRQRDGSAAPEGGRAAYYAIDRNFRQKLGERERERQAQKQTAQDLRQKGIESKGTHVYRQGDDVAGRVVKKGYEDAAQGKKERPYVVVEQNGRHYYNNDRRARALGENQFVHMRSDGKLLSGRYAHQSAARAGKAEREQEQADSRERDGSASERGAASEGSRADSRGRERGNGR